MAVKNWLQEKLADVTDAMVSNLKFVLRGKIVVDLKEFVIKTEGMYIAVVDKETGKDILKKHLPFQAKIETETKYEFPIEVKGDFVK